MIKRYIVLVAITILSLFLLAGCGFNYNYQASDFTLEISVDKHEVIIGDTLNIYATLKNLSGKDIKIESFSDAIEGIISIYIYNDPTPIDVIPCGQQIKRKQFVLKKDALITVTREFVVDGQLLEIETFSGVSFYLGKSNENTYIQSEVIKVLVKQ